MHFVFSLYVTNGQVNHKEKYGQEHNPLESGLQTEKIDISNFETTIIVIQSTQHNSHIQSTQHNVSWKFKVVDSQMSRPFLSKYNT